MNVSAYVDTGHVLPEVFLHPDDLSVPREGWSDKESIRKLHRLRARARVCGLRHVFRLEETDTNREAFARMLRGFILRGQSLSPYTTVLINKVIYIQTSNPGDLFVIKLALLEHGVKTK